MSRSIDDLTAEERLEIATRRGDGEDVDLEREYGVTSGESSESEWDTNEAPTEAPEEPANPEQEETLEVEIQGVHVAPKDHSHAPEHRAERESEGFPRPNPTGERVTQLDRRAGPWPCATCGGVSFKNYRCNAFVGETREGELIRCGADLAGASGSSSGRSTVVGE